jgi:hypothetical protein
MKFTTAGDMMKDYVYYVMVENNDGTYGFPPGMDGRDCYSSEEEAEAVAESMGLRMYRIVEWDVD